jgi:amino-acid N-acetyltransferase
MRREVIQELAGKAVVRRATLRDARQICALVKENPEELMVRALGDIVRFIDRFFVISAGRRLLGCASYSILPDVGDYSSATVELRSVAIRSTHRGMGLGSQLVDAVLAHIRTFHKGPIIVLTYTPEFFAKSGFARISKRDIMHKIYSECVNCTKHGNPFTCPEVAMAYAGEGKPGGK